MQPTVPKAPTHALNRRSSVIKYTAILFAVIVSATVVYIIFSDKVRSERDLSALLPGYERLSTFGCENTGEPFAAASAAAAAQKKSLPKACLSAIPQRASAMRKPSACSARVLNTF